MTDPRWIGQFDGTLDAPSPYSYGSEPPAGWRPFSEDSAWNTPIPASPTLASDSVAVMDNINGLATGPINSYRGVGGTDEDFEHPRFYVAEGDPEVRVKQAKITAGSANAGRSPNLVFTPAASLENEARKASPLQNRVIRVPENAAATLSTDGHLAIVSENYSYEFLRAQYTDLGDGYLACWSGGIYDLAGDGLPITPHGATASGASMLAGQIRMVDLVAGHIPHALAICPRWVRRNVFDPITANGCATPDSTTTAGDAQDLLWPVTGSRWYMSYTEAEVDALALPAWKTTILHAMREYGMIVIDTGGAGSWWFQLESGGVDVAESNPDRWLAYGDAQGWTEASDPRFYTMDFADGIDWTKLKMVDQSTFV